jgi:hypothetical protein
MIEAEKEREREERVTVAGKKDEPEVRRLKEISEERQRQALKVGARANDGHTVKQLQKILREVADKEVLLRRTDSSLILSDVQNKRRKEEQA